MENDTQQTFTPIQPIPQTSTSVPTPISTNSTKILLFTILGIIIIASSVFIGFQVGRNQSKQQIPQSQIIPTTTPPETNQVNSTITQTVKPTITIQPITIPSDWKQYTATDPDFGVKTTMSMPPGYSFRFTGSEFTIQNDSDATELWDYSTSIFQGKNNLKNYYTGVSRRVWYQEFLDGNFMSEKPYQFIPGKITNSIEHQIGSQSYLELTVTGGPPANYSGEVETHYLYVQNGIVHIIKTRSDKANSSAALIPNHIGTIFASLTSSFTK